MMVTIKNSFSGMDISVLKKNEDLFQRIAQLVKEADGRKKSKIKVIGLKRKPQMNAHPCSSAA